MRMVSGLLSLLVSPAVAPSFVTLPSLGTLVIIRVSQAVVAKGRTYFGLMCTQT